MRMPGLLAVATIALTHGATPVSADEADPTADLRFEYKPAPGASKESALTPPATPGAALAWKRSLYLGSVAPQPELEERVRDLLDDAGENDAAALDPQPPSPWHADLSLTSSPAPAAVRLHRGGAAPGDWDADNVTPEPLSGGHVLWAMGGGMALRGTSLRYGSEDGVAFLDLSAELGFDLTRNAGLWLGYQRLEAGFGESRLDETANRESLFVRLELRF